MRYLLKTTSYLVFFLLCCTQLAYAQKHTMVVQIDLDSAISPASADYFQQGLDFAIQQHATALLITMDTPGGLDESMRAIITAILNSSIPVITYVAPNGARAASAGTYILYASHIAAMAPSTHLGAATPIDISPNESPSQKDSDLTRKMKNDAVAYLRSLAELRHRNVTWGSQAILKGATLTAPEALQNNVIDFIAPDTASLLQMVQGKTVIVQQKNVVLNTHTATIVMFPANWRVRFLELLTNPSLLYLLFIIAFYGLFFELASPGYILPGVVGTIALLLALYATHLLPVSYTGLSLMILGVAFMVAETFVSSFGALGIGGIIAFIIGSIMLLPLNNPLSIPITLIAFISGLNALFFIGIIGLAVKARRRKVITGKESIIGTILTVPADFATTQHLRIGGELWLVRCDLPLIPEQKVRVIAVEGVVLVVTVIGE